VETGRIILELRRNIGIIGWDLQNLENIELKKSREAELKRQTDQLRLMLKLEKEAEA
jgi:hypothetical protein